jgi:hypothetical protein
MELDLSDEETRALLNLLVETIEVDGGDDCVLIDFLPMLIVAVGLFQKTASFFRECRRGDLPSPPWPSCCQAAPSNA